MGAPIPQLISIDQWQRIRGAVAHVCDYGNSRYVTVLPDLAAQCAGCGATGGESVCRYCGRQRERRA